MAKLWPQNQKNSLGARRVADATGLSEREVRSLSRGAKQQFYDAAFTVSVLFPSDDNANWRSEARRFGRWIRATRREAARAH